jgi:hypothetical protein
MTFALMSPTAWGTATPEELRNLSDRLTLLGVLELILGAAIDVGLDGVPHPDDADELMRAPSPDGFPADDEPGELLFDLASARAAAIVTAAVSDPRELLAAIARYGPDTRTLGMLGIANRGATDA